MHVILTHEQADFDALASLLGAHLLNDSALPVLPRKMNRNVRAFLNLYGLDLPFVDPRDLSGAPIETLTLVDTQGLVSLKGFSDKTQVRVVDHHPRRENLSPAWQVEIVEIGATTTLMVEGLKERDTPLSQVQATLLLLGIYEDTGSLTYTRTHGRDLRAAAFLLEQGASLQIAANFLNHPLSPAQQALYDELRAGAESVNINGHNLIIACAAALELDEELSSITHKLRDLLDPPGLFVLVGTRGGVQMIARSTVDQIDVAAVLTHFGGGGHARAAACLVRGMPLEQVRAGLLRVLPQVVLPSITVAQIMSRGPQLLYPHTPVEEAAARMRRYGYEGYPVVAARTGAGTGADHPGPLHVVGLLNRRAVDRAISHKLFHLTAANLMDAGEVTVGPDDALEHVQRLMIETGWGQIPVVQPESGDIVGIVTRTDLLKTLAPEARLPGRQNLAARLEASLPSLQAALIRAVAQEAHHLNAALYIVGGFVRDLLLERPGQDFDLVVEGDAIALARALEARFGGRVTTHARFGTAKWHIEARHAELARALGGGQAAGDPGELPVSLDLISARTEFYTHPTALPTVERGSIKLDLHRRDFTFNTLALRLDGRHYGELHDYWGGYADLRQRLVRVLHSLSFVDDPTRMLRAVRFEQRFTFQIEARSLELLQEARPLLAKVSGDRIRHELDHIFSEAHAAAMMDRLHRLELLAAIHPALTWDDWLASRLAQPAEELPAPGWEIDVHDGPARFRRELCYILWLLRLPREQIVSAAVRLKLPAGLTAEVHHAAELWRDLPELDGLPVSQVTFRLDEAPPAARYAVYRAAAERGSQELLQAHAFHWREVQPITNGDDLRARGLKPGPVYRQVLGRLRAAWLDGEVSTPAQEAALLENLLQSLANEL